MILKHLPNVLTLFRIGLIAPFLLFLYHQEYLNSVYTYFAAGFTDNLDGFLARRYGWQSTFGSFVDPLADKLLITASFISLALIGMLPWWLVMMVIIRDITIMMGVLSWYLFISHTVHLKATTLSKWNTAIQLGLVTYCLCELAFFRLPDYIRDTWIILTSITTTITFFQYIYLGVTKAAHEKEKSQ